jgi:hypothetical protein
VRERGFRKDLTMNITLKTINGKHIVTEDHKQIEFDNIADAWDYIVIIRFLDSRYVRRKAK